MSDAETPRPAPGSGLSALVFGAMGVWLVDVAAAAPFLVELGASRSLGGAGVLLAVAHAVSACIVLPVLVLSRWSPVAALPRSLVLGAPAAVVWGVLSWDLLSGPWISRQWYALPSRLLGVLLGIIACTLVARLVFHLRDPACNRGRRLAATLLLVAGVPVLAWADQHVLLRLYPSFHLLLLVAIVAASGIAGLLLSAAWPRLPPPRALLTTLVVSLGCLGAVGAGVIPGQADWLRALTYESAPLSGKLLRLLPARAGRPVDEVSQAALSAWLTAPRCDPGELDRLAPGRRRWNMLWITIDTVRADHVGCYGYARATTANLDALALLSVRFENCYSQGPTSGPSMASMFNGRYMSAFSLGGGRAALSRDGKRIPTLAGDFRSAGFSTEAVTALPKSYLRTIFRFLRPGFERFNDYPHDRELQADQVVDHAIARLDRPREKPYFLWVHLFDPHDDYLAHDQHRFGDSPLDLYDGEIAFADAQMGRLLAHLKRQSDADRTVVVVHSDHGEEFLDHGGRFHNSSVYDEQVRVPLLIHVPGAKPAIVSQPVEIVDLVPTLVNFFDLKRKEGGHGHSLLPFVFPQAVRPEPGEKVVPAPLALSQIRVGGAPPLMLDAVRLDNWKLIHDTRAGTYKLFDLARDPGEERNLSLDEPARLSELKEYLEAAHHRMRHARPDEGALADLRASDAELLRRAGSGPAESRLSAARVLALRGREHQACDAITSLLEEGSTETVLQTVLDLMLVSRHRAALPLLHRLAGSDWVSPLVRARVSLTMAATGAEESRPVLRKLARMGAEKVSASAHVALGLLGDGASRDALEDVVTRGGLPERYLAVGALTRLGDASRRPALGALLGEPTLSVPDLYLLAMAAIHDGSPELQVALYGMLCSLPVQSRRVDFLEEMFAAQTEADRLPFLRIGLGSASAKVRERCAASLGRHLTSTEITRLGRLQQLLDGARAALKPGRGLEDGRRACAALEQAVEVRQTVDWGAGHDLWQALVATNQAERGSGVLDKLGSVGTAATVRERLSIISGSRSAKPSCKLEVGTDPIRLRSGASAWPLNVTLSVPEDACGLEGGPVLSNTMLLSVWHDGTGQVTSPVQRHSLPPLGVLPGRSVTLVLSVSVPQQFAPGPVTLTLGVARRHPAGYVSPPTVVELTLEPR